MQHKYTKDQIDFLTKNVKGRSNHELTEIFNKEFELNLKLSQIKSFKKNNKLSSGLDGRFKNDQEPWNKGKKGFVGANKTSFKKGSEPHNYLSVGTERINGDGYVDIKIEDPNKWKGKHILIWEKHNGPTPKGHAVIFGDGNNRNFDKDNLILVSRKQLLMLNRNNLIQNSADLTKTAIIITDIYSKINEKKK